MRSQRVLVVDDESESADLLKLIIEAEVLGSTVDVAYDGLQALTLVEAAVPDVVIMDLEMPKLGGQDAAQKMRDKFGPLRPCLVALSGNVSRIGELRHAGPFDFALTKPLDISAVLEIITDAGTSKDK
jgi:two-component system nitrogen regulation response regulator GlnG